MGLEGLLKKMISEHDDDKRYYLMKEVGELGRVAVKPLVDYLKSDSPDWQEVAAIGIRGIAQYGFINLEVVILNALEPLIQTLRDNSIKVRIAAVDALGQVFHRFNIDGKHMDGLNPRLRNLVSKGFDPMISMLDDESIDVRLAAAKRLRVSGIDDLIGSGEKKIEKRANELLIEALDHESPEVRRDAAGSLNWHHDEEVKKKAQAILDSIPRRKK